MKQGGLKPSERISFSMVTLHDETAILFGGVYDLKVCSLFLKDNYLQEEQVKKYLKIEQNLKEDDEEEEDEENDSVFFNDVYKLDLVSYKWSHLNLR